MTVAGFSSTAKELAKNPLGIIALFIVLIYGFAAIALVATSAFSVLQPEERLPLIWFLVLFPVLVLLIFGWLVSSHHEKLYAPSDYKSDDAFLEGKRPNRVRHTTEVWAQQEQVKAVVLESLTLSNEASDASSAKDLMEVISAKIDEVTKITVDAREFTGNTSARFDYPVAAFESFGDLTDEIYFSLGERVRPFEYGYSWVLVHATNGKEIANARMITGTKAGVRLDDLRSLNQVGVNAGDTLVVMRPSAQSGLHH